MKKRDKTKQKNEKKKVKGKMNRQKIMFKKGK